jgi:hypothetical protein
MMNEKIRKFAVMSFDIELDRRNFEEFSTDVYGVEKFAQLVIKECVDTIMNDTDRHRKEYFAGLLKEHFGIEE